MAKKKKAEVILDSTAPAIIEEKSFGDVLSTNMIEIASYVNNHRSLPNIMDGCKDSYRRLIYAAVLAYNGRLLHAPDVLGSVMKWHPHDVKGIEGTMADFVKAGVFSGEGSFGSVDLDGTENPHAAPRYLEVSLSPTYHELIGELIKEVPMVESPNGALEPIYVPLPLPLSLCLRTNVSGLGFGISTVLPSFKPQSLYNAYINNNPDLLELNINLNIDREKSELHKIWTTGKGSITYYYNVCRSIGPDGKSEGVLFTGDTDIFTPNFNKFKPLIELGGVYTVDLTDKDGPKYFVGRVPNSKKVSIEDIEHIAHSIYYKTISYDIEVTDGNSAFSIPMYDWIGLTYKSYLELISRVNDKKIQKTLFDISVLEKIPEFVEFIKGNPTATRAEVQVALKLTDEQLSALMARTLSSLVREDKSSATIMDKYLNKLNELKSFNPVIETANIISKM